MNDSFCATPLIEEFFVFIICFLLILPILIYWKTQDFIASLSSIFIMLFLFIIGLALVINIIQEKEGEKVNGMQKEICSSES
jgi:uncharacterized protein YebE (UPF0316 family)